MKFSKINPRFIFCHLLIILSIAVSTGHSQIFEASGSFIVKQSVDLNDADLDDVKVVNGTFSILVSNCFWKIRWAQSDEDFDFQEMGTDGIKVYTTRSLARKNNLKEKAGKKRSANEQIGHVEPGHLPNPGNSPVAPILWWIFASSCYLQDRGQDRLQFPLFYPEVIYSSALFFKGVKLPTIITRRQSPPFFLQTLISLDDGKKRDWSEFGLQHYTSFTVTERQKPYNHGFTNAILSVNAYTNFNALEIPSQAYVKIFFQKQQASSANDLALGRSYTILTTNLYVPTGSLTFIPEVTAKIFVADDRFLNSIPPIHSLGYLTDKKWLDDIEVQALKEYQTKIKAQQIEKVALKKVSATSSQKKRGASGVFIIFLVISPIVLIIFLAKRKHQQKQKKYETIN